MGGVRAHTLHSKGLRFNPGQLKVPQVNGDRKDFSLIPWRRLIQDKIICRALSGDTVELPATGFF